jgi:hypothetical protein
MSTAASSKPTSPSKWKRAGSSPPVWRGAACGPARPRPFDPWIQAGSGCHGSARFIGTTCASVRVCSKSRHRRSLSPTRPRQVRVLCPLIAHSSSPNRDQNPLKCHQPYAKTQHTYGSHCTTASYLNSAVPFQGQDEHWDQALVVHASLPANSAGSRGRKGLFQALALCP